MRSIDGRAIAVGVKERNREACRQLFVFLPFALARAYISRE